MDAEFAQALEGLDQEVQAGEIKKMLGGEHDRKNAIVAIHPGAGGTESQDWAEMLLRMYLRWAERQGFATEMVEYQPAEEAGIKSATFTVNGDYAYGLRTRRCTSRPLTSRAAGIHLLPAFLFHRKLMTQSRLRSSRKTFARIPTAPAAKAAST